MALALAVALLGLVLEDLDLLAALVAGDLRLDLDLLEIARARAPCRRRSGTSPAAGRPSRPRRRAACRRAGTRPSRRGTACRRSRLSRRWAWNLRSSSSGVVPAPEPLPARERRRPPRRPRRRAPDSRASAPSPSAGVPRGPVDRASPAPDERSMLSIRTSLRCPTRGAAPVTVITSASTRATASPGLYMCGSSIESSTSSPTSNGSARRSISSAIARLGDLERVDRQRVAALEQERLAELLLELEQTAVVAHQLPRRPSG